MNIKLVLFFLLISRLSFSQVQTGVVAGVNMMIQDISTGKQEDEISYLSAGHAGVLFSIPVAERLSLRPGLNYQLKGYKQQMTVQVLFIRVSYQEEVKYHYIELPLNLSYAIPVKTFKLTPYAGIYAAFAMSGTYAVQDASGDVTVESVDFDKDARRPDYGCQLGVGLEFTKFFLRLQYSLGLADIDRVAGATTTNSGFGLSAGYWILPLKK